MLTGSTIKQTKYLVKKGCVQELCNTLTYPDPKLIEVCLDCILSLLEKGKEFSDENIVAYEIEKIKALDI